MANGLKSGYLLDHGKYRIEGILGPGGFGITYLATDLGLDKLRAIKEFFPKDYCDRNETTSHVTLGTANTAEFVDKLKKKFLKEARNIANLDQHQGIITIHAVFEENNTAYYVMDYIDGLNLSELVKREGPLPVEKAIKYITEVGNALAYVHQHHINHLDIKPANIMIRRKDDMPILIDFGLSKQYDSEGLQTSTTPTGISHGYAPIEQYHDGGVKEFAPQTDVYSLAATLYYLVSGKVPPHATTLTQNDLSFPDGFPYFLKEPISKAMSTKRGQRHESVKEFVASLKPEAEITVIEVPNRSGSFQSSENEWRGNIPVPENKNESFVASDTKKDNNLVGNIKNKDGKTREKRKYNLKAYIKNHKKAIIWYSIGIVIFVGSILFTISPSEKDSKNINDYYLDYDPTNVEIVDVVATAEPVPFDSEMVDTIVAVPYLENFKYKSSLGLCSYTGEGDENDLPHGHGVATWEKGEGKEYDGEWVHGKMEGETKYTHRSGDTFEGTFKNNQYAKGKYTIKKTGEYFVGTFKNGQPEEGKWFNKNGDEI